MQLILPNDICRKLAEALTQAGRREIGGIMMGEHTAPGIFRVKDLTVQRKAGAFSSFQRIIAEIIAPLRRFFDVTKHDYKRFNYLGEWHSHPSFALIPSGTDDETMRGMAADAQLGANFIVLLLVKLDGNGRLDHSATVYRPGKDPFQCAVVREDGCDFDNRISGVDERA